MKLYIKTSYISLLFVLFSLLFFVTLISLSFNSLNNFPSTFGLKLINMLAKLSENSRLVVILMMEGTLLFLTIFTAYIMYSFSRTKKSLISAMNTVSLECNYLNYRIPISSLNELNKIILMFNQMISTLEINQNAMKNQIEIKSKNLININKQIEIQMNELKKVKQEAESVNKTRSEFITNISHELRTPLNAIMGYSEILKEDAEKAGYASYCLDLTKIINSTQALLVLINSTLDLRTINSREAI